MFYQNGNMLISLCQHLKVNEQRSWMKLNSVPLLLRTILCYPKNPQKFWWDTKAKWLAEMNSSTVLVSGRAIFFEKYESKTGPPSPISGVIITKILKHNLQY